MAATAKKIRAYVVDGLSKHEEWLEVEATADAVRVLALQFKLGVGPFRGKGPR